MVSGRCGRPPPMVTKARAWERRYRSARRIACWRIDGAPSQDARGLRFFLVFARAGLTTTALWVRFQVADAGFAGISVRPNRATAGCSAVRMRSVIASACSSPGSGRAIR